MKAIVGLGNPGEKYRGTRHNIGFAVVDELARRRHVTFESAPADALIAKVRMPEPLILVKPLTFMNNSGQAVGELARYFKVGVSDLLIVVDEVDLPLAKLRARARGSAGGHNGLKSIIEHLGTEFARLRVGVGRGTIGGTGERETERNREKGALASHVLARFDKSEAADVERMTARAADAADVFITSGIEVVMNQFNGGDPAVAE
jgi:PTH1 family peptidyl-tRNA hydrolase